MFHPRPDGAINTGSVARSISEFLPTNHLGIWIFPNNHLDCPGRFARFIDTHHPHHRVFEPYQAGKPRKLVWSESECNPNIIERFENRIVLRAVDSIRAAPYIDIAIHDLLVETGDREKHVARRPGHIDRAAAVESEILVPVCTRGEFLPAFDLLEFFDSL